METLIYKRSDAIIVLTQGFKEEIIKRGIEEDKIFVVMNGAKREVFNKKVRNSDLKDKFNTRNKIVIGYAGSLGPSQGLMNIVETAAILEKEKKLNVLFLLLGEGDQKEPLIKASEGLNNIVVVGGKERNLMPKYLSLFNIGLAHLNESSAFKTTIPS